MNFFLRAPVLRVFFPVVAAILCVCEISWAQSQEKPAEPAKTQTTSGPAKPVHKPDWVTTNDPVALLAVRRAPRIVEAPSGEPAVAGSGTAVDATTKRGEIAELERQIQSKQKRIALLMRLFVTDERPFLVNPSDTTVDASVQERRRYEQDELKYESAEIAKLRARLEALKAEGAEKAAESKQ